MGKRSDIVSRIERNKELSAFEKAVYCAVLGIPEGEARSYIWVARSIGRPRAARAVGNALNKNPYIRVVPCHRVVKSDGTIGGFSRGVAEKKKLLRAEGIDGV